MKIEEYARKIKYHTIDMLCVVGSGHLGGSLSISDILAVLYGQEMKIDPSDPNWDERDYFVLSKGHGGPGLYAALAVKGFFPLKNLYNLNKGGMGLPSHPDRNLIPGVEATTGSLGQGISQAVGLALGARIKKSEQRVYVIVGDGELQEGQCWEAIQHAAHANLSNLTVFVDYNKMQLDGVISDICKPFDLCGKFTSFGCHTQDIDGHCIESIQKALLEARKNKAPSVIIAHTIKGHGIQGLSGKSLHHIRVDDLNRKLLEKAMQSLGGESVCLIK